MTLPCRKNPYPSRRLASAALRRLLADGDSRASLNVYRCPVPACERAWHVGHLQPWQKSA